MKKDRRGQTTLGSHDSAELPQHLAEIGKEVQGSAAVRHVNRVVFQWQAVGIAVQVGEVLDFPPAILRVRIVEHRPREIQSDDLALGRPLGEIPRIETKS